MLALGNPASCPAPDASRTGLEDRWLLSPWLGDALRLRSPRECILLIGSGLSAVDAVLALHGQSPECRTYMVSRRGTFSQVHRLREAPASVPTPVASGSLRTIVRELRERASEAPCWRLAIDALRPVSNGLWNSLPLADQRRFLRHLRPYWETHRHRMAPQIRARLDEYHAAGRLEVLAGRLRAAAVHGRALRARIALRSGGERLLEIDRIINCTGIHEDYRERPRPLIRSLLETGLACANELGLSFRTDGGSALAGAPGLYTLGPPRRGELFETTAVPEIRVQAEELARRLLG